MFSSEYKKQQRSSQVVSVFFFFLFLFIFGCVGSTFLCEGFLQLQQAGATLHRGARASYCRGLSVAEHRLQTRRLTNCGSRAQLLRGMWDLPRPGLEPVSPALAGRFSTTAPPGKPSVSILIHKDDSEVFQMKSIKLNQWKETTSGYG